MYSNFLKTISSFFARFLRVFSRSPQNAHPITNYQNERQIDRNLDGYTINTLTSADVEKTVQYFCEFHELQESEITLEEWEQICNVIMISAMATEVNQQLKVAGLS